MVTVQEVVTALKRCVDPELNSDIVTLGLIYGISISPQNEVKVTLTMTSPMCPVTSIILADVTLRLEAVPGASKADVDLVWDPAWSPEMMADELKYR
jgi:metal-sulfur cluster biosynthetic enzyme